MEAKESYSVLPGGMEPLRVTSIPEEVPVLQDLQPPVVISCLLTSSLELGPGLACRGLSSAWMDHFGSALAIRSHPSAPALPEEKEASTHLFLTYVQIESLSFKFQLGHLIPRSTKRRPVISLWAACSQLSLVDAQPTPTGRGSRHRHSFSQN